MHANVNDAVIMAKHCESSPDSFDEIELRQVAAQHSRQAKRLSLCVRL